MHLRDYLKPPIVQMGKLEARGASGPAKVEGLVWVWVESQIK